MDNFTEKKLAEFDERFLGCDYPDCVGINCSKHQFKQFVAGRLPEEFKSFIAQALQEKDEAHKAEMAKIREAMINAEQTMHMTTAVIDRTSPSDYQDGMLRMIEVFDSAVK